MQTTRLTEGRGDGHQHLLGRVESPSQHHETWERPHYTRLHLPALRRLQRTLLGGLRGVWGVVRERVRAGLADMLRR